MNQVEPTQTAAQPEPSSTPPAKSAPIKPAKPRRRPLRAFGDFFWRGRAIGEVLANAQLVPARARELHRRAKLSAEAARRAIEPSGPFANGPGDAIACELYREAVYWTLAALASARSEQSGPLDGDFRRLWNAADRQILLSAAGDADTLAEVEEALAGLSFVDYPDLPPDEQRRLAFNLRRFAEALLALADAPQARLDRLKLQRYTRIGLVALLFAASVPVLAMYREVYERRQDLARGRPWQASSHLMGGCKSPQQRCSESPGFFFHTIEEENASLVIDLGKKRGFSAVRADNRGDCCPERAVPLVIEVSDDKKSWKKMASRSDAFRSWKATFPRVEARYVRLRTTRKTWLHLSEVRVLER